MKNFFIAFLVFLVWSFFAIWLYSWLQPTLQNTPQQTSSVDTSQTNSEATFEPDETLSQNDSIANTEANNVLVAEDGMNAISKDGDVIFSYKEGISFQKNSVAVRIEEPAIDFKYKLNTYMLEHPDEELHILSHYSADENIVTPNFGMQRGNQVKAMLMELNIPSDRMVVKSIISEIPFDEDQRHNNGIRFAFRALDTTRIAHGFSDLVFPHSEVIYPRYSTQGILVNDALRTLLEETNQILSDYPQIRIKVIGHTDNVGNSTDNYVEGLSYARQVRWYLVTKGGIDRKKIIALSEGERQAIATNKTQKGRELNRRIEVVYY